ncbi:helix-turn-helix domain-containing protein [Thalassospira indica]|uniref:helix-turn-helix domain-containing protein n=1 Tax=Thalassospira indica TaxID=1891279 RepID=UPI001FE92DA6|nr:helix-turn-helix domain-containing protein [Thalassospira indica]
MTKASSKNIPAADHEIDIVDGADVVDAADKRKGIQSVEVSGVIIAALCDFKFPVPLKDLADAVGMPAAKVHRYLASLVRIGLAWQDDMTGLYGLGPMALRMGYRRLNAMMWSCAPGVCCAIWRLICDHRGIWRSGVNAARC